MTLGGAGLQTIVFSIERAATLDPCRAKRSSDILLFFMRDPITETARLSALILTRPLGESVQVFCP
jgi:hypothetical protein